MDNDRIAASSLDKRALGPAFRARLRQLIARAGVSKSAFAARIGVDRSALTQLLSDRDGRLPRAETLAAIARDGDVSLDWLLGLSEDDSLAAEVAPELAIEERAGRSDDSRLLEWRREAQGAKIRYVPAYLPDLLRLPEVTALEHKDQSETRIANRVETDRETLALSRAPEADMEVCMPRQRLELLAEGRGFYTGAPKELRARQIERMAGLLDELYPTFRLFLFDGQAVFSNAYTVFGAARAAIYMGDMYFVLNAKAHIQALSRHFDRLIRTSEVDARDASAWVATLRERVE